MLVNVLALVVVLGILVFMHEGGHFLAARLVGAPVSVFSLGFGKRLFGFERGGTDYRVSLIPLGGYVRVDGLGPDESDVAGAEHTPAPLLPRWKRTVILLAGPAANVLGAVAFLMIAFMMGVRVPAWESKPPRIAWVDPSSPAATAGLEAGDLVLSINGSPIRTWRQLEDATMISPGQRLSVTFRRDGADHTVSLTPRSVTSYDLGYAGLAPPVPAEVPSVMPGSPAQKAGLEPGDRILSVDGHPVHHFYDLIKLVGDKAGQVITLEVQRGPRRLVIHATPQNVDGRGKLGIPPPEDLVTERYAIGRALRSAGHQCVSMTRSTFVVIGRMITGHASIRQMSGPIDIAKFSGAAARTGLSALVWLLGVISLQLAIFNILPIPLLDGGHIAIIGIETVIRRDLSDKVKERILTVGFWLIIALFVVVMYNDILKNLPQGISRLLPGH